MKGVASEEKLACKYRPTMNKSIRGFPLSCSGWGMQILPQMLKIEIHVCTYPVVGIEPAD